MIDKPKKGTDLRSFFSDFKQNKNTKKTSSFCFSDSGLIDSYGLVNPCNKVNPIKTERPKHNKLGDYCIVLVIIFEHVIRKNAN